jgi:hypothetical protein
MRGFVKYIIPSIYYEDVRNVCVLGAAVALLASGCGTSTHAVNRHPGDEAAAKAVVRVQAQLRRGNFALAWQSLHPAERRVLSVQRLSSCYPRNEFPRTVTFRAKQVRDIVWQVPGTKTISEAKEVTVTATSSGKAVDTFKQHVVRVGRTWTWMLSRHFFNAAKNGKC